MHRCTRLIDRNFWKFLLHCVNLVCGLNVAQAQLPEIRMHSRQFVSPVFIKQIAESQLIDVATLNSTTTASLTKNISNGMTNDQVTVSQQSVSAGWVSHLKGARGRLGFKLTAGRNLNSRSLLRRNAAGYLVEKNVLVEDELAGNQWTFSPTMAFTLADSLTAAIDYNMAQWTDEGDGGSGKQSRSMKAGLLFHGRTAEIGVVYQTKTWGHEFLSDSKTGTTWRLDADTESQSPTMTVHGRWMPFDIFAIGFVSKTSQEIAKKPYWQHELQFQVPMNDDLRIDVFFQKRMIEQSTVSSVEEASNAQSRDEAGMSMEYRLNPTAFGIFTASRGSSSRQIGFQDDAQQLAWKKQFVSLGAAVNL